MDTTKANVLLAEDDENLGVLLREYLKAKGYETDLYSDVDAAFKGFQSKTYDIGILDVMMPEKDGFTLAKEIRQLNTSTHIIVLTAKSIKEELDKEFSSGPDA